MLNSVKSSEAEALALFQALADLYPDDNEARLNVLKTTVVTADTYATYLDPDMVDLA